MSDSDHDVDDDGGLEVFFEEVKTQVKEFHNAVSNFAKADKNNKKKKGDIADKKQKSALDAINIFKSELKSADDSERRQFEKEFKKQEERYKEIASQLKDLKENKPSEEPKPKKIDTKPNKDDLFGTDNKPSKKPLGATQDEEEEPKPKKNRRRDGMQKQEQPDEVNQILEIQNQTTEILHNMISQGEETIQVGLAAQEKLKEQTEKMVQIQRELDELGSGLKRARKELNAFMRGLACDHCMGKIIIASVILLALAVVAIIILRSIKPDIFNPQTAPTPVPTPTTTTIPPSA